MKRKLQALAGLAATLGLAAVAAVPAAAERGSYNNWHVHDGGSGTDANGLVHRGLAFFPAILTGGDVGAYLQDPAYCPDATDKLTLPAGTNGEFPLVGQCQTNAVVIHLRAIPAGDAVPSGYQSTGWTVGTGGAVVYYSKTAR
ncbi:MAG TPA: hypothetical protein VFK76_05785 [Gaiellaceae bacterium]|nr:hypothetical protein [Gaiellaceae bacterium]